MEQSSSPIHEEDLHLKDEISRYLRFWPFLVLSCIIALIVAFLYLKYATYSYKSQTTILIKDENNSAVSELAAFDELGIGGSDLSPSSFDNEIEIIKSKRLLGRVVDKLELTLRYIIDGNIKSIELFENIPFKIKVLSSLDNNFAGKNVYIKRISETQFDLKEFEDGPSKRYNLGERIVLSNGDLMVLPGTDVEYKDAIGTSYIRVQFLHREHAVSMLQGSLSIEQVTKYSSVIRLSLVGANKDRSEVILDNLVEVYNEDAINDRNLVSKNTADFIDKRLSIITLELDSVETGNVEFRERNQIIDIATEGQLSLENAKELNRKQRELITERKLTDLMTDYLKSDNQTELLPTNTGIESSGAKDQIENYNQLILERNRLLQNSTALNPVVIQLSNQIDIIKENILSSLETVKASFSIQENDLQKQQLYTRSKLSEIPSLSKGARDIARQQGIKESLYLYLLKKREETAIALAVTTPKAKIVDKAYSLGGPIAPKKNIVYLIVMTFGLLIPIAIIYLRELFDTKIHNRLDIEKRVPSLSILGEIPIVNDKENDVITTNDRSILAEAFRIVRTNIGYFLNNTGSTQENVVFVTSTIKGEGKTFIAYNLALTLRSTGKSVLLIGADIRNPQLHRYINQNVWTIGLSEYLHDNSVDIGSITNRAETNSDQFDIILSGRIPPNPAELLMNSRFDDLIHTVKQQYDYVIVDTAPTLLVTDTLLISQKADMTVYVSRADFTDKKLLQYPEELVKEGKLKKVALIINGIKITNFGYGSKYGYGYGYGYGQDKLSFFKKLKKSLGLGN